MGEVKRLASEMEASKVLRQVYSLCDDSRLCKYLHKKGKKCIFKTKSQCVLWKD